ncbi:DUF4240 domain-containing protein [Paractinoplanes bogorensis]|nr:DUF4240 domain-containing protein [Actinoplanes bogorensis]
MDEDVFWPLAGGLGRHPDDDAFERLTDLLAGRSEADITGFADRLADVLWALDTPAHFQACETVSDDVFLYVRCAVVGAGRKAYERVLSRPGGIGEFADEEAELLLTVAEQAYERKTGRLWEHETPVSYEAGSNTGAWGDAAPDSDDWSPPWLDLMLGSTGPAPVHGYEYCLGEAAGAVIADPAWQKWWATSGVDRCELLLLLDSSGEQLPSTAVKRGRKRLRIDVVRVPGPLPDDPDALMALAVDEIRELMSLADLGPVPPLTTPAVDTERLAIAAAGPVVVPELPAELMEQAMRTGGLGPFDVFDYFRAHPDAPGADVWLNLDPRDP